jgi:hypothetical protein
MSAKQTHGMTKQGSKKVKGGLSEAVAPPTESGKENTSVEPKKDSPQVAQKSFWEKLYENPIQLLLVAFTALIVLVSGIQIYFYREMTHAETRAYLSVIQPRVDTIWNKKGFEIQGIYTIENFGKTPAYGIIEGARFGFNDTIINDLHTFPYEGYKGVYVIPPQFRSVHYVKLTDSSGGRLHLYGRIHYVDQFGITHFTSYGFEFEQRIHRFELYPYANDGD